MENRISIETAQNVTIEHHLANLGERIVAYLVDGAIQIAYLIVIILIFSWADPRSDEARWLMVIILGFPFIFYHLFMEIFFQGQSVGKMAMKIKVVKLNGAETSAASYFLRWLFRFVDITLFSGGVAVISIAAGGRGQRVGDILAGTTVVSTKPRASFQESYLSSVDENYEVVIPEVALLTDDDIETIKDVMSFVQKNQTDHSVNLAYKTKTALEEKMGVSSDMKARMFFETVLRDYTHYHTSLEQEW